MARYSTAPGSGNPRVLQLNTKVLFMP